jgi:hypothetical protein
MLRVGGQFLVGRPMGEDLWEVLVRLLGQGVLRVEGNPVLR